MLVELEFCRDRVDLPLLAAFLGEKEEEIYEAIGGPRELETPELAHGFSHAPEEKLELASEMPEGRTRDALIASATFDCGTRETLPKLKTAYALSRPGSDVERLVLRHLARFFPRDEGGFH